MQEPLFMLKDAGKRRGKQVVAGSLGIVLVGTVPLFASSITGNPSTDSGWTEQSTSLIQGLSSAYDVNVYSTAFTLTASSPLSSYSSAGSYGWNTGDTIVGVGGVFTGTSNALTYSGGATTTRFVVKYGTSSQVWTVPGNNGSLTNGGVGALLLGTFEEVFSPSNAGTLLAPSDSPELQTGPTTSDFQTLANGNMGGVVTAWNGSALEGFESFMDLTLLDSEYPTNNVALGDKFVLDLQDDSSGTELQDLLGTLPTAVPEPGTLGLLTIASIGLLARRRRRV